VLKPLADLSILVVEDDPDSGELLVLALESRGARCRLAETRAAAVRELTAAPADVLVCDLNLPDGSGLALLSELRAVPGMSELPAVAVSGHGSEADRERSLAAGFAKHLIKPAALADIVTALTILTGRSGPFSLKPMLARLAEATSCRYTSFLRFEGHTVISVWTYDRENDAADAFPLRTDIEGSYCILVQQSGKTVIIEDAVNDPRAAGHVKQHALATYAGAPVFGADGRMAGTLCAYDEAPQTIGTDAKRLLAEYASQLEDVIQQGT
jgi:CheY-like chemotaxis protein